MILWQEGFEWGDIAVFEQLPISGLVLVTPSLFRDERGFFMESWRRELWASAGISLDFEQDNHSLSQYGTLRGLHYQTTPGQGKLIRCTRGKIWDVAVDLRKESSTYGRWHAVVLDSEKHQQFWIPVGFAHGFCVLSQEAEVQYKCTSVYNPKTEAGIAWNDPDLAIEWPIQRPLLSQRDQSNPSFRSTSAVLSPGE